MACGNIFVFTLNQARPHFDDRHRAAKAAVHLRKLQTDIAAANDDQMLRHESPRPSSSSC